MSKGGYVKPNPIVIQIYRLTSFFMAKVKLNCHVRRNDLKGVKGPCVILMNHETGVDHCCLSLLINRRATFVVGEAFYNTSKFFWLFKLLHTVNKKQFRTEISDIKKMKAVVDDGGCLIIFPAGVCTSCGSNTELPEATGKFLKLLKTDVYVAKISGVYLSRPKWSSIKRRGATEVDAFKLFSADELKKMSHEEVYHITDEALKFDEYEWQEDHLIRFKNGNNVVGMENVLYDCPICGGNKSIVHIATDTLACQKCGFKEKADEYGFLHKTSDTGEEIRHPSDWFLTMRSNLRRRIEADDKFEYRLNGDVFKLCGKKHRFDKVGRGEVVLSKEELVLLDDKGEMLLNEPAKSYISIPSIPGKYMDLQYSKGIFRFYPDDGKDVNLFLDTMTILFDINEDSIKKSKKIMK